MTQPAAEYEIGIEDADFSDDDLPTKAEPDKSQQNGAEPIEGLAHTHITGAVTELRALGSGPVLVGHYTDLGLLARYAVELNGQGYATYACINPVRPECATGLNGRPARGAAAGDAHISALRYLVCPASVVN
jgi:hypothetical protein